MNIKKYIRHDETRNPPRQPTAPRSAAGVKPQLVAATQETGSDGKKIKGTKVQPEASPEVAPPPANRRKQAATQAADPESLFEEYKKNVLARAEGVAVYTDVFENEEEDGNAIMITDYALLLKTIHDVRIKCNKIYMVWLEDGLYFTIIDNSGSEKNVFFFSAKKVPRYRFNGTPRYYYISPRHLSISTTASSSQDSFLIIHENSCDAEGGTGKEKVGFHTYSFKTKGDSSDEFVVISDPKTNGILKDDEEGFPEIETLRLVKPGYKWDIVASTAIDPDFNKKLLKSDVKKCEVIYDKATNSFRFVVHYGTGGTGGTSLINEAKPLELSDPFSFRIQFSSINVLKSIKHRISQKLCMTLEKPGFLKLEIVNQENVVCNISVIQDVEDTKSITVKDMKVTRAVRNAVAKGSPAAASQEVPQEAPQETLEEQGAPLEEEVFIGVKSTSGGRRTKKTTAAIFESE